MYVIDLFNAFHFYNNSVVNDEIGKRKTNFFFPVKDSELFLR